MAELGSIDIAVHAPVQQPDKPSRRTDRLLGAVGITLAAVAAFFPWYVFFNEDKFGITVATMERTRDLSDIPPRNVFSVSPMAMVDKDKEGSKLAPVDSIVTATVSKLGNEEKNGLQTIEEQPFPGRTGFRLLHVANGRALIEDSSGIYMVRVGSTLPDNSRLATLEQRDGRWVIVTSKGEIVPPT